MAERLVHWMIKEEELISSTDNNPFSAYCPHQYCPSSIHVQSININGEEYYYLSYIPHFHKSAIYKGDKQYLPPFLQYVLYYYSGLGYFTQQFSQLAFSSYSTIHYQLLKEKQSLFITNWKGILRQLALNDFGNDFDGDSVYDNDYINGKFNCFMN